MNYAALIDNRKSVRAFKTKEVPASDLSVLRSFYEKGCHRLDPSLPTELTVLDAACGMALAGAAGYEEAPVGAPHYLVLLSGAGDLAGMNGGYMMEDLILKLSDMGYDSCWITFTDAVKVKEALGLQSPLEIVAIAAFGYGEKQQKKMRLNIFSMSCVDIIAQRGYYAPKKDIPELAFADRYDNIQGLDEQIGFYEDMLWQSLYAASKAPSYLNRQPYAFILKDHNVVLAQLSDPYTDALSFQLDLGIVMLHFAVIAEQWMGKLTWDFESKPEVGLPDGSRVAAVYHM